MQKNTIWTLKSKSSLRFKQGHPWVYSNELAQSPKGVVPGDRVELRDSSGKFLAWGYGNPHSLISFRELSRESSVQDLYTTQGMKDFLVQALIRAWKLRQRLGFSDFSHRLCFGEADGLPGLVIDRYRTENEQVFVVQAHTAGADQWMNQILDVLQAVCLQMKNQPLWDQTSIVLRNDLNIRKLEGIDVQEPRVLKEVSGIKLELCKIWVRPAYAGASSVSSLESRVEFFVDLVHGQKTGFFLDQWANIETAIKRFGNQSGFHQIRILDLFCYVGQWSTQLSRYFRGLGVEVEVVAVDSSAKSLELAKSNVEAQGARCEIRKLDILENLNHFEGENFDLVICDPPALIKSKKDIVNGTRAYQKLNSYIVQWLKPGGGLVTCSCSALFTEENFNETLNRSYHRKIHWIAKGIQSPDHPFLTAFPEGRYLKALFGIKEGER